jgi:MarR family 2-MHQ and catechol resistance regulon transcriptional repressor
MSSGNDERLPKSLVVAVSRVMQGLNRRLEGLVRKDGLTGTQWDVMAVLYSNECESVNGLIDQCLTSSGNIDVVLSNLVTKGYIRKERDSADRRRRLVTLTDAGRAYVAAHFDEHLAAIREYFAPLTPQEQHELRRLLHKVHRGNRR